MSDEVIVSLVSGVGFPAAVCFYLIIKVNAVLERLVNTIEKLDREVSSLGSKICHIEENLPRRNRRAII